MAYNVGLVGNVALTNSSASGANVTAPAGASNEQLTSQLHGQWYNANRFHKVFHGNTTAAGTIVPISSTTAPTFTLYNPIGSGINVEMIAADVGATNATLVVSPILLGVIWGLTVAPTAGTPITPFAGLLGQATAVSALYSALTLASAATNFFTLGHITATAGEVPLLHYDFQGALLLPPGSLVFLCGTAAQTSASANHFAWAEWPI